MNKIYILLCVNRLREERKNNFETPVDPEKPKKKKKKLVNPLEGIEGVEDYHMKGAVPGTPIGKFEVHLDKC